MMLDQDSDEALERAEDGSVEHDRPVALAVLADRLPGVPGSTVVPIVGEAIRQVGPILLASRPEFDDLMDGLTLRSTLGLDYLRVAAL